MKLALYPDDNLYDLLKSDTGMDNMDDSFVILSDLPITYSWSHYFELKGNGDLVLDNVNNVTGENQDQPELFQFTGNLFFKNETYKAFFRCKKDMYFETLVFIWSLPIKEGKFNFNDRKLVVSSYQFETDRRIKENER